MKVIQIGESLLNVNNISELELDLVIEVDTLKYYITIQMSNGNVYRQPAPNGSSTNLIDFFKNKIVTIGEDNEV